MEKRCTTCNKFPFCLEIIENQGYCNEWKKREIEGGN